MIAFHKIIPIIFLFAGFFLLLQAALPIFSYKIWEMQNMDTFLVSPIVSSPQVLGVSVQNKDNFPGFVSSLNREFKSAYGDFSISIPRLKIVNAKVTVDSNDLTLGLVHLPGSALPGEKGNVFISGHSDIRGALFANLVNLKKGDLIDVDVSGLEFNYQVIELKVVDPNDLSVISPPDGQNRYLTLMTCVPPGLNVKRLIVLTKLI